MRWFGWLALALCLTAAAPAAVRQIAPGDAVQPLLDAAQPGDVLHFQAGRHRGTYVIENGGEPGRPLVLEGAPGAVLDGSVDFQPQWVPADDVAAGVWRTPIPFEPFTVTADGKILTMLREDRVDPDKVSNQAWHWPTLFRDGVGPSKWDGVRALALYRRGPGDLLVRFKDQLDPRTLTMTFAPRTPILALDGADRVVIRNLTMQYGAYGVLVEHSLGTVIEGCTIGACDYSVWLGEGSSHATVRGNEMFLAPYSGADPWRAGAWDNWQAHKTGGHYDRFGVEIRHSVGYHRVHDNYIHDHWDGIEDVGQPGENVGLRIHHNHLQTMIDDGLEPNGAEEDCSWDNNLVEGCICGFRIKSVQRGPLYAYRNLFLNNKEDYRNYGEVTLQPAVVYVYHNTCTAAPGIQSNKVFGIGTPRYHYYNNLFWCVFPWANSGKSVDPNWQGDYNVWLRRGNDQRWDQTKDILLKLGLDAHSLFAADKPGFRGERDLALTADSPARGRGGDLRKLIGAELPGLSGGPTPDCGALEFGQPMPVLPRPAELALDPPAGTWPAADVVRKDPWSGPNLLSNGDFAQGFEGWNGYSKEAHAVAEGPQRPIARWVTFTAPPRKDLQRTLPVEAGHDYVLVYLSRQSTFSDFRVIVRNVKDSRYLTQGQASGSERWRRTVLRFAATGDPLRLELSPRSDGRCDLAGLAVYEAPKVLAGRDDE